MANAPIVSVLMTAYNRQKYIADAIESVLNSSFNDFELIIVDDVSEDDTVAIAQGYAKKDPRIRVYVNERNLGDYPNRNRAASHAVGEYLKYLDSDDILFPHTLDVMVRCMAAYPEAGFGLCAAPVMETPYPIQLLPKETFDFQFGRQDLFGRAPGSSIIRRWAFERVGGFSGIRQIGDFELWLRMASIVPMVVMPRDLHWSRVHQYQEQKYDSPWIQHEMKMRVLQEFQKSGRCPLPGNILAKHIKAFDRRFRVSRVRSTIRNAIAATLSPLRGN